MDPEADPLIQMAERKDLSKRKDVEDGSYYSKGIQPEAPPAEQKGWFKRNIPSFLNMFTFFLAAPFVLQNSYAVDQTERWYGNVLLPYALFCYAFGSVIGIVLKFTEGNLLATYFPKKFGHRKISIQEFQEVGASGYWQKYGTFLGMAVYIELTASTVGRLYALNPILVEKFPGFRTFSVSLTTLEPATLLVIILSCILVIPMWHNLRFDLTWFGVAPLFIANSFPWGFPMYRILAGCFGNFFRLVQAQKDLAQSKAGARAQLSS